MISYHCIGLMSLHMYCLHKFYYLHPNKQCMHNFAYKMKIYETFYHRLHDSKRKMCHSTWNRISFVQWVLNCKHAKFFLINRKSGEKKVQDIFWKNEYLLLCHETLRNNKWNIFHFGKHVFTIQSHIRLNRLKAFQLSCFIHIVINWHIWTFEQFQ